MMLLRLLDLFGVVVFAISGTLTAGRKRMDILGVYVIAIVTAIGGGTLRDVLLNRPQIFWFHDTTYIYLILITVTLTMLYTHFFRPPGTTLLLADALGLAVFTVIGTQIGLDLALPTIVVLMIATITSVAGGVIRDILCAEIPLILRQEVYFSTVIAGSLVYLLLNRSGAPITVTTILAMCTVMGLRIAAIFLHLQFPRYELNENQER